MQREKHLGIYDLVTVVTSDGKYISMFTRKVCEKKKIFALTSSFYLPVLQKQQYGNRSEKYWLK